jgi:hypothetical protein
MIDRRVKGAKVDLPTFDELWRSIRAVHRAVRTLANDRVRRRLQDARELATTSVGSDVPCAASARVRSSNSTEGNMDEP